jgi:hypothetical protein
MPSETKQSTACWRELPLPKFLPATMISPACALLCKVLVSLQVVKGILAHLPDVSDCQVPVMKDHVSVNVVTFYQPYPSFDDNRLGLQPGLCLGPAATGCVA